MKAILIGFIILLFVPTVNSQKLFIYGEKGEKIYLQEIDSLIQIKFRKDASFNDQLKVVSSVDPETKFLYSKSNHLIIPLKKGSLPNFVNLNKESSVTYANKSLISADGILQFPTEKVLVKVKASIQIEEILHSLYIDYESISRLGSDKNSFLIKLKNGESIHIANQLYESGYFEYSQPSFTRLIKMQNEFYPNQWGLNNTGQNGGTAGIDINAPEAWATTRGCDNIRVAVIDQGVDLDHPDLAGNLLPGFDATDGGDGGINGDCWGNDAHGTCCAGIIGAVNNTIGTIGVAHNCRIIPVRVSYTQNDNEIWDDDWVVNAINHAWEDDDVDVLSCSWRYQNVAAINNEINNALTLGRNNLGCVIVFASGNSNNSVSYPANSNPDIIAVGAMSPCGQRKRSSSSIWDVNPGVSTDPQGVSCDNEKWWGSNYGNELDLIAPGVFVPTTDIQGTAGYDTIVGTGGNYYQMFNGTSSATPHVAGVAALILSVNPGLTQDQVRDIIESTCTKVGSYNYSTVSERGNGTWNSEVGYGCVNAFAAIQAVYPFISGPSIVCSSGATYTVNDVPIGCTVSWNKSDNLSWNSGTTDNPCSFYANDNGPGWLEATIIRSGCGGNFILPKCIVWVGKPDNSQITLGILSVAGEICYDRSSNIGVTSHSLENEQYTSRYDWNFGGWAGYVTEYITETNVENNIVSLLVPYGEFPQLVEVRAENVCGMSMSTPYTQVFSPVECGYYYSLSPNPASDNLTVTMTNKELVSATNSSDATNKSIIQNASTTVSTNYTVRIFNTVGTLKYNTTISGKSFTIPVNNLRNGNYLIIISDGKNNYSQQFIVKHY